nr:hypothetical protein [Legionella pneumophila]
MEILTNILSLLKVIKTPRITFGIFLFCFILILLPPNLLVKLGMLDTVNQYRGLVGITALLTFIIWLMQIFPYIAHYITNKKEINIRLRRLESLSDGEKELLKECIANNQQSIVRPITDSAANSLCQKGLLMQADQGHIMDYPFIVPDKVWNYLKKNKDLLHKKL